MMKKALFVLLSLASMVTLIAQDKLYIFRSDKITLGALISKVDSLVFTNDYTTAKLVMGSVTSEFAVSTLDSITFGDNDSIVTITYEGSSVRVMNPLAFEGVTVSVNGADVTITSVIDSKDITYRLSGTTSDGMFKIYSDRAFNLELSGVNITNSDGPAINVQSRKSVAVTLLDGTTSTLTDGATYATATVTDGEAEDQKALFFSEARLEFGGSGALILNGKGTDAHALCTDESLTINSGILTVTSAVRDGLHGQEGIYMNGGTVTVTSTGSCLDGDEGAITITDGSFIGTSFSDDTNALNCDSTFSISGGSVKLTLGGAQSKGIKCDQDMFLSGGSISITVGSTGKAVLEATSTSGRYDPAYCAAIKCDGTVCASGTNITITHIGAGGKGISTDVAYLQTGGIVSIAVSGAGGSYVNESGLNDYYNATGITSDGSINIQGGTLNVTNSSAASKGLSADGAITLTGGTTTIKPQGAAILTVAYLSGYDPKYCTAIKSGTTVTIDGTAAITLTMTGAGAKGISTGTDFLMNAGTLGITSTGAGGSYKNSAGTTDGYQSTCITTDGTLNILGGTVTTSSTGTAGKGLNSSGILTIGSATTSPTVSVTTAGTELTYCSPKAINSNAAIAINGGTINVSSANDGIKSEVSVIFNNATVNITKSTEGVEAPIITVNSGTVNVTASDDAFNGTKGNGGESSDGSLITFAGGRTNLNSTGGDALDSNGSIKMTGGVNIVQGPSSSPEVGIDVNGTYTMTGGFMVASGPNSGTNMIEPTTKDWSTNTLYCLETTSTSIGTTIFHIQDASGTDICTYKPIRSAYYIYVISPNFKSGTYSIYTGGSYSTTATNGFYTGGTYTAGTLKKSVTLSTTKFVSTSF
jgi:trimeric autotransporter adhesin